MSGFISRVVQRRHRISNPLLTPGSCDEAIGVNAAFGNDGKCLRVCPVAASACRRPVQMAFPRLLQYNGVPPSGLADDLLSRNP